MRPIETLRSLWKGEISRDYRKKDKLEKASAEDATLISSRSNREDEFIHYPCIDLDNIPLRIVESSTTGNCHLYIDIPMSWTRYAELLLALQRAELVQKGFVKASLDREQSFVRANHDKHGEPKPRNWLEVNQSYGFTYYEGGENIALRNSETELNAMKRILKDEEN